MISDANCAARRDAAAPLRRASSLNFHASVHGLKTPTMRTFTTARHRRATPRAPASARARARGRGAVARASSSSSASSSASARDADDARRARARGRVHVICGPMFAGKTTHLMRCVERERARGRTVFVIKSELDVERFGEDARDALIAHDGKRVRFDASDDGGRVRAVRTLDAAGLGADAAACDAADVVAVDEAQFMGDLAPFARRCAEELGQTVYVCGLDGDYRRERFGGVLDLIPLCDTVTRLRGTCAECGDESLFSRRVEASEDVVRVGGRDKYAPVCRACYVAASTRERGSASAR